MKKQRKDPFGLVEVFSEATQSFSGNTSIVIMASEAWDEAEMQQMASDWNQPATTFLFPTSHHGLWDVRWFAPDAEIGLCGHGSLAAFAYLHQVEGLDREMRLRYRTGEISGRGTKARLAEMELDAIPARAEQAPPALLSEALGKKIIGYFPTANKDIVLLQNEEEVRSMKPDFSRLRQIDVFGYSITAPGTSADFVSRTLVPHVQQLEDHATGSSHAALAPFWAGRLGKNEMLAYQLSPRGGAFRCKIDKDKVSLGGHFRILAQGSLR